MDKYELTLKRRKTFSAIGLFLVIAVLIFAVIYQLPALDSDERAFMVGFQTGILAVMIVMLATGFYQSTKALNDEAKRKTMYIKEMDERQQYIDQKAGSIGMNVVAYGMSLSTAIAGSFNETVFFSLLAATVFIVLVRASLMFYYRRKY